MRLAYLYWNVNPEIFHIGGFSLRYYSVWFGLAFLSSYLVMSSVFKREGVPDRFFQKLVIYVFIGTVIGARLGHTLFYEFSYYKHHILEIILPFTYDNGKFELTGYQGLASHGGAIGILTAVDLYCRKYKQSFFWVVDRLGIVVTLSAFFIRLGNFFNSEIIGRPASVTWAIVFQRVDSVPRHPAQLYEAVLYLVIFGVLWLVYSKHMPKLRTGFLFGLFLTTLFTVRFFVEFIKENQEPFENRMAMNLGQLLSIPFIIFGLYLIILNGCHKKIA